MKHSIHFNLPDDADDLKNAMQANKLASFIQEFDQGVLRQATKYSTFDGREVTEEESVLFYRIREIFWEMVNEEDVKL